MQKVISVYKLNHLLKAQEHSFIIDKNLALDVLDTNSIFEELKTELLNKYSKKNLKTICFTREGVLSLLLELEGKIAVSLGESEAIVQGAKFAG